jgi:hypothetical protein
MAGPVATTKKVRRRCNCGALLYTLRHRKIPLRFDSYLNEFHIAHPDGGYTLIRFCPFCGARFPESRRDERLFHKISDTERERIKRRFGRLRTYSAVVSTLGKPDVDNPSQEARRKGRLLSYLGLSKQAFVQFAVGGDGKARLQLLHKPKPRPRSR